VRRIAERAHLDAHGRRDAPADGPEREKADRMEASTDALEAEQQR
jgi:hypothetical protein